MKECRLAYRCQLCPSSLLKLIIISTSNLVLIYSEYNKFVNNLLLKIIYILLDYREDMRSKMLKNKLNKNWIEWFIGFNDAEGNFQVYPKKRVLKSGEVSHYGVGYAYHLSLHSRDAPLIKTIQEMLNVVLRSNLSI